MTWLLSAQKASEYNQTGDLLLSVKCLWLFSLYCTYTKSYIPIYYIVYALTYLVHNIQNKTTYVLYNMAGIA